jgi:hypothetical protein
MRGFVFRKPVVRDTEALDELSGQGGLSRVTSIPSILIRDDYHKNQDFTTGGLMQHARYGPRLSWLIHSCIAHLKQLCCQDAHAKLSTA